MNENTRYIFASDYDGTLNQSGKIDSKTIDAIKKLREYGHLFGIVTGRDYFESFNDFSRKNEFPFDFIVMNNGAQACDKYGNLIFSHLISATEKWNDTTLLTGVVEECLTLTQNRCIVSLEKEQFCFLPDCEMECELCEKLKDIDGFVSIHAVCNTTEQASNVADILNNEYGAILNSEKNGKCIDIIANGIDKSTGLERLARYMKVQYNHIFTIGDNYNDICMLKKFHGCAIANSPQEVLDNSKIICSTVGEFIKMIIKF